jgi:hypothetical protein
MDHLPSSLYRLQQQPAAVFGEDAAHARLLGLVEWQAQDVLHQGWQKMEKQCPQSTEQRQRSADIEKCSRQ